MKSPSIVFYWALLLLLFYRCQNDTPVTPVVTTEGISEYRQTVDTDFEFKISIAHASPSDVSVDYTTRDGTAVAGVDFIPASGTAIIPAGSLSTSIQVKVKADSLRRDFQFFYLDLGNPRNCTLANQEAIGKIENSDGLYLPVDNTGYSTPDSYPNYNLVWSDEFNGNSIDENTWAFDTGGNGGWGNHESEYYTNRTQNAFVSSGNLIIEARKEKFNGAAYTSARMTTKGKKSFRYGRIDIRAKVPIAKGTLSSLWMLGLNIDKEGWPTCGEIDIMQLGRTDNSVYQTLHWETPSAPQQFGFHQWLGNVSDNEFHVFTAVWDSAQIEMYIDDRLSFNMSTDESLPFNNDFFFIFSLAIGGDWPGSPDGTTTFPQRMVVDYVRVFQ